MRNKKKYSEEWTDTIRPNILKRDNYKCTRCGVKHRAYVLVDSSNNYTLIDKDEYIDYRQYGAKTYRIFLQVHHIDGNRNNNIDTNLISVCVNCHFALEKELNRLKRLSEKKN